tara:strand:- start:5138 stop:5644 length:507 start_codon:yes stop_codon:yes gene_type:complete
MASGDTLFVLKPGNGSPPATLAAALTGIDGASVPAERYRVTAHDDTAVEHWDYKLVMPQAYAGTTGVTLRFWSGGAAASGNYILSAAFRRVEDDTNDIEASHTYDYNDTSAITAPTVIGEVGIDSLTFTDGADIDSVAAGDMFILRVRVNGGTIVGDTYIHQIEVQET